MIFEDMLCRDVVEMVTDYLEGVLPADEREGLERHIASCPGCEAYLEHFRTTIRLSGSLAEDDIDAEMMEDLVGVFRAWRNTS